VCCRVGENGDVVVWRDCGYREARDCIANVVGHLERKCDRDDDVMMWQRHLVEDLEGMEMILGQPEGAALCCADRACSCRRVGLGMWG
jgi:hypothetical protein